MNVRFSEKNVVAAILVVAFLARLALGMTVPVTGDASYHYAYSRFIAENARVPGFENVAEFPFYYPPLFHVITAGFYLLSVPTLAPVVIGFLGVVAFYFFSREFFKEHALQATALIAFLPLALYSSAIGYVEILLFLTSVLSFLFYFRFLKNRSNKSLALSAFFAGLSVLTHFNGLIVPFAVFIHMLSKNRKKSMMFLAIVLVMSSFWYVRNYDMFGNPVWPKIYDGKFPGSAQHGSLSLSNVNAASLQQLFFDFWTGPPNSDDFIKNISVGRERFPFFDALLVGWLACIFTFSFALLIGLKKSLKDERLRFFIIPTVVLFLVLWLTDFVRYARMFFPILPLIVISIVIGFKQLFGKMKLMNVDVMKAVFMIGLIAFVGACFSYAFVYKGITDDYAPYYDAVRSSIPKGAVVFCFSPEIAYYAGVKQTNVGNVPTMVPASLFNATDVSSFLASHGVDFFCCDSLKYASYGERERGICEQFFGEAPFVQYENGSLWGKCWSTK